MNVVGYRKNGQLSMDVDPYITLEEDIRLFVTGTPKTIQNCLKIEIFLIRVLWCLWRRGI